MKPEQEAWMAQMPGKYRQQPQAYQEAFCVRTKK